MADWYHGGLFVSMLKILFYYHGTLILEKIILFQMRKMAVKNKQESYKYVHKLK